MNSFPIIRPVIAGLMILLGALIYIIYRTDIIFIGWIPKSIFDFLKILTVNEVSSPGYFVIYCLPDGLWYGALLIYQSTFLGKSRISKTIFQISVILPFVWEILQIFDNVPGTFDPLDLLIYALVLLIFLLISKKHHDYK